MNTETEISLEDFFGVLKALGCYLVIYPMKHSDAKETAYENECIAECASEAKQETPNQFIVQHEQERADMAKLGLSDLEFYERDQVKCEAKKYIKEHKIEDEDEKVKVHHMMRDHYLAYKEHLKNEK